MSSVLEIAVFNIESALLAAISGADRLELCENPLEGGTTPSYGFLKHIVGQISIPVFPIIRPRGGDFLYSDAEFKQICYDIELCKDLGFKGVVSGVLLADGQVDYKRTKELVSLAGNMQFTFHRAFDRTIDPIKALATIIESGAHRILTSGQVPNAFDGKDLLKQLIEIAENNIIIMPGSGVKSDNIETLIKNTNAIEFHTSARTYTNSKMEFINENINEQLTNVTTMSNEIQKIIKIFENC